MYSAYLDLFEFYLREEIPRMIPNGRNWNVNGTESVN